MWLDVDAAGHGWGPGAYDLAAVLTHELGHVLGLDHAALDRALAAATPDAARRTPAPTGTALAPGAGPTVVRGEATAPGDAPASGPARVVAAATATVGGVLAAAGSRADLAEPGTGIRPLISVPAVYPPAPPARDTLPLLWWALALAAMSAWAVRRPLPTVVRGRPRA